MLGYLYTALSLTNNQRGEKREDKQQGLIINDKILGMD
jgi:hypothetical protein